MRTTYMINDSAENGETCIMAERDMRACLRQCAADWANEDEDVDTIFADALGLCVDVDDCRDVELLQRLLDRGNHSRRAGMALRARLREIDV